MSGRLICGDALKEIGRLPADSIDLIMTSPPYADMRKKQYGGVAPSQYVAWYSPIARALKRVLKPAGNYVLVIKERTVDGERSTYVHDLIADHRAAAWRWHEEYIWFKTKYMPGKFNARLPDAWEHCLHFARARRPWFNANAARRPSPPGSTARTLRGAARDERRVSTGGHHVNFKNFDPYTALGPNVLTCPTEGQHVGHPAAYPVTVPSFFIPLMCPPTGIVLDPFIGSGTTALAAERLGRQWIGIDRKQDYIETARARIGATHVPLDAAPGSLPESRSEGAAP